MVGGKKLWSIRWFFATVVSTTAALVRRVIVDQDTTGPGTTNTMSIAALLCAPDVIVEGITVATGDGWRDAEVGHVLRLLELLNRTDVPVIPGSLGPMLPLSIKEVQVQTRMTGKIGWMGAWETMPPDPHHINASTFYEGLPQHTALVNVSAAEFIARTVRQHPHEVTILALAPMTNIAAAMAIEPRLPQLAKELVFMGGSVACIQSARTNCDAGPPWHEFNFWFDPHSAQKVLRVVPYTTAPWARITILPADVASQPTWTANLVAAVKSISNLSLAAKYITDFRTSSGDTGPLFDELTVLYWVTCRKNVQEGEIAMCDIIDGSVLLDVDVSVAWSSRGMMLTWPPQSGPGLGEQLATVFLGEVHIDAFERSLVALLTGKAPPDVVVL